MNKSRLNFVIDLSSALLLLGLATTGYILHFRLPPKSEMKFLLWGMSRHDFGEIHFYFSIFFLISITLHVFMHWGWVRAMSLKQQARTVPLLYLALLLLGIAVSIGLMISPVNPRENSSLHSIEG